LQEEWQKNKYFFSLIVTGDSSMVFGLFEGSIELQLDKTNLAFGETVHGKLNLKLKKEKQARQLRVRLEAIQTQRTMSSKGSRTQETVIYSTEAILDGEKTYMPPGQEYEFSIQAPARTALPAQIEGGIGTAIKAVQMLSGMQSYTKWYINASLDIPGGMDINKRVQISVQ
jgi:hypothetical protein